MDFKLLLFNAFPKIIQKWVDIIMLTPEWFPSQWLLVALFRALYPWGWEWCGRWRRRWFLPWGKHCDRSLGSIILFLAFQKNKTTSSALSLLVFFKHTFSNVSWNHWQDGKPTLDESMMDLGQGAPKKPRGKAKAAAKSKASKDSIKAKAKTAPKKKIKKPASAKARASPKTKPSVTRKESQARAKPSGNGGRKEKDTVEKKMHSVSCFWIWFKWSNC